MKNKIYYSTTIELPVDLIYNIILIQIIPQIWSDGSEYKGCWNMGETYGEETLKKPNKEIKT